MVRGCHVLCGVSIVFARAMMNTFCGILIGSPKAPRRPHGDFALRLGRKDISHEYHFVWFTRVDDTCVVLQCLYRGHKDQR